MQAPSARTTPNLKRWGGTLCLLTALFYLPSVLGNSFVSYDDYLLITKNLLVQELSWSTISGAFSSFDPELYVPLTILSYQIEHALFGFSPIAFHAVNLLLHLASTGLVISILYRLSKRSFGDATAAWLALIGGVLFALHPQHTEAVVSASARKDILSSCLALLSIWFYLKAGGRRNSAAFRLSIGAFLLALLAKVSVIMLPLALVLIDLYEQRTPLWKNQLREKVPYLVLSVLFGIVALYGKRTEITMLTPGAHLLLAVRGMALYIVHLLFPFGFSVFYPAELSSSAWYDLRFLLPIALLPGVGILLWLRRSARIARFGAGFFLLMQLPSLAAFSKNGFVYYASDRYAYLPDVGLILLIAAGITLVGTHGRAPVAPPEIEEQAILPAVVRQSRRRLVTRPLRERSMQIIVPGLMLLLGILSWQQSRVWKDSETLFRHILNSHPTSVHALNNLGSSLFEQERYDEALEVYQRGIAQGLYVPELYGNMGKLLHQMGKDEDAIQWFTEVTLKKPAYREYLEDDFTSYYFLAQMYERRGQLDRAFALFREAATLGDAFFTPQYNLGIMEQKYGHSQEAFGAFTKAVQRNPRDPAARYRLAAVAAELGDLATAAEQLTYIVKHDPDYEEAARHLRNIQELGVRN